MRKRDQYYLCVKPKKNSNIPTSISNRFTNSKKKIKKKFKNLFSAPLINAAVDRYNRIDDRIHHQELISEVANRISMLEREKEYLTRQLNSSLLSRPTLWV